MSNYLEQEVKAASTRRSNQLADDLVNTMLDGQVFTHPELDRALLKPALEKITVDDCLGSLRRDFGGNGRFVVVTGNVEISGTRRLPSAARMENRSAGGRAAGPIDGGRLGLQRASRPR
jgi:hypothetical protein